MRIRKAAILLILIVVVVSVLSLAVSATDDTRQDTTVTLSTTGVNISVDSNIAEWGYALSTDLGIIHHTQFYPAFVSEGKSLEIKVNLPSQYQLYVSSPNRDFSLNENTITLPDIQGASSLFIESKSVASTATSSPTDSPTPKKEDSIEKEENQSVLPHTSTKSVEVSHSMNIEIPSIDENGVIVDVPISEVGFSELSTGTLVVREATEEYNALNFGVGGEVAHSSPSGNDSRGDDDEDSSTEIEEFHIETIVEAMVLSIPVSEDGAIGGNGNAPILIERNDSKMSNIKFWSVVEVTPNVSGGKVSNIAFEVPLSELEEQGFTPMDVVMYHGITDDSERKWYPLVTTLKSIDAEEAHYSAETDGASPFGILFMKDTTRVPEFVPSPASIPKSPLPMNIPLLVVIIAGIVLNLRNKKSI